MDYLLLGRMKREKEALYAVQIQRIFYRPCISKNQTYGE